jgi:hypothetical protein
MFFTRGLGHGPSLKSSWTLTNRIEKLAGYRLYVPQVYSRSMTVDNRPERIWFIFRKIVFSTLGRLGGGRSHELPHETQHFSAIPRNIDSEEPTHLNLMPSRGCNKENVISPLA